MRTACSSIHCIAMTLAAAAAVGVAGAPTAAASPPPPVVVRFTSDNIHAGAGSDHRAVAATVLLDQGSEPSR